MSVQESEECFASKNARILVNEEDVLRAVAVEPKRCLACQRVNVGISKCIVDERRFPDARVAPDEEADDVAPDWRVRCLLECFEAPAVAYVRDRIFASDCCC